MPGDDIRPFGGRDLLGLSGMLVGCIVGWTAVGLLLDHWVGSSPVGVIAGVGLGIASAAAGFVIRMRQALHDDDDDRP